jgi:microcystin-dependent protein
MSEPFLGEIRMTGWNFASRGWALCNGQLMSIAQNTALFSLLGTTYGGDGITTFALPNLQGRVPIHQGQGPGLTNRTIGEVGGAESVTLLQTQMPAHNHLVSASQSADGTSPGNSFPGNDSRGTPLNVYNSTSDGTVMNPAMISSSGGNQPHDNMQPYLCVSFMIALEGIFPSRS